MAHGVHSEVGKLRKVMVHRPGLEHARLTPSNVEELLFDDVIWVKRAIEEHDVFAERMRDHGVEVFDAEQLFAEALADPKAREWVVDHILNERTIGPATSSYFVLKKLVPVSLERPGTGVLPTVGRAG